MTPMKLSKPTLVAPVALGLALLCALPCAQAQAADALPLAKTYLVTGNYVVGSVDFDPRTAVNGSITGTVPMSGVPANADILAAFLYWEMISTQTPLLVAPAKFNNFDLNVVKGSGQALTGNTASCWSSGGGSGATYTMTMFRADVLRFLPEQMDANGKPTGRRLVNGTHTVTLPEAGTGNQVPQTAGASLFVVYRDPTQPLTHIAVYDGIFVQPPGVATTQTIRGFLQASASPAAKMTQIVGSGAPNSTDQLWFNGSPVGSNPFAGSASPSSDRSWSGQTIDVSSLMPTGFSNPHANRRASSESLIASTPAPKRYVHGGCDATSPP